MRRFICDIRPLILLLPALAVLAIDLPVMLTLLYSLAAMLVIVTMAHLIRRILFPYVDLSDVENMASESPTGAGLVFLGISVLFSSIVLGTALWIAK